VLAEATAAMPWVTRCGGTSLRFDDQTPARPRRSTEKRALCPCQHCDGVLIPAPAACIEMQRCRHKSDQSVARTAPQTGLPLCGFPLMRNALDWVQKGVAQRSNEAMPAKLRSVIITKEASR
jgi:hypothetical protein